MKRASLAILACVAAGLLASCVPETTGSHQPATAGDIVGTWRQGETVFHLQFSADGTFRSAESLAQLETEPFDTGTYTVEESRLKLTSGIDSALCPGQTGIYHLQLDSEGQILMEREQEECSGRSADPIPPLVKVAP